MNFVHYLFIIICVYKHHILLLFFFPMYSSFVFFFSTSIMLFRGVVWAHLWWQPSCHGSLESTACAPAFGLTSTCTQEKQSRCFHSSILNCCDVQGPKAVWWLCFTGRILSTVFAITLLSLGISRGTGWVLRAVMACSGGPVQPLWGVPLPSPWLRSRFQTPQGHSSCPQWPCSVTSLQLPQPVPRAAGHRGWGCPGAPQPALLPSSLWYTPWLWGLPLPP